MFKNIKFVMIFSLMLTAFVCITTTTHANKLIQDITEIATSGQKGLDEQFYESVISDEDIANKDINVIGFDTKRFDSKEEEAKYMAALVIKQIGTYVEQFSDGGVLDKADMMIHLEEYLEDSLDKNINELNEYLDMYGGDILKAEFDFENYSIAGIDIGELTLDLFAEVDIAKGESYRKLDEQLLREAYAELGVDNIPENVLSILFNASNDKDTFIENLNKLDKDSEDWLKDAGAYYAYSVELSDNAIKLMEAAGLSTIEELNDFYQYNKDEIRSDFQLENFIIIMEKEQEELINFYVENTVRKSTQSDNDIILDEMSESDKINIGKYEISEEFWNLWTEDGLGNTSDINVELPTYITEFKDPEAKHKFLMMLEDYKNKYGVDFTDKSSPLSDDVILHHFYQDDTNKHNPLKLVGKVGIEHHSYINRIEFKITKKDGLLGNIDVANMEELNTLAAKYSPNFANAYKKIMGDNVPHPKILDKTSSSVTIELNYEEAIKNKYPNSYYDIIRNNFSQIKGNHNRNSLNLESYIPTLSLNAGEKGVYIITANIYYKRYYSRSKTYTITVNNTVDGNDNLIEQEKKIIEYFPYRQIKRENEMPLNDDTRNIEPDSISGENHIKTIVWEINVGTEKLIVPPYGVKRKDIYRSNFITN